MSWLPATDVVGMEDASCLVLLTQLGVVGLVAAEGLCGMEVVEVSPPYDHADITSLMGMRIAVDVLGSMVAHGKMGAHKSIIDKPFVPF